MTRANSANTKQATFTTNQYSTNDKSSKIPANSSLKTYENQLPENATVAKKTAQQHKTYFSKEEINHLIIGYTQNRLTVNQLAEKYGCSRQTISNVLKRNGVTVTRNRMDENQIKQAKKLYSDGLTLKQVSRQLGICESTVTKTLRKAGATIRRPHRYASKERAGFQ
ncbi:MAG: HTH domain-containing protein [Coriobacteriales bacterium]|nr:HTH domain-containing protein [Coriobacteriales bacterium]